MISINRTGKITAEKSTVEMGRIYRQLGKEELVELGDVAGWMVRIN